MWELIYLKKVPFVGSIETIVAQNLGSDHLSVCTLVTLNLKESWQLNLCHYQLCCKQKGYSAVPSSKWFCLLEHPGVPIAWFCFIHRIGKSTQSSLEMYVEFAIRNIIMLAGIKNLEYSVNFEFYICSSYYLTSCCKLIRAYCRKINWVVVAAKTTFCALIMLFWCLILGFFSLSTKLTKSDYKSC